MMLQSLRDWLIRMLGGVTESDRVLQCREWIAIGRFQAQVDNMAHALAMRDALQQIRDVMDAGIEQQPAQNNPRTH